MEISEYSTQVWTLIALVVSIISIVIAIWSKLEKNSQTMAIIKDRFNSLHDKVDNQLNNSRELIDKVSSLAKVAHQAPELTSQLARQWDFVEKTFHNRYLKHEICRRIVNSHLKDHRSILIDSGSTVDLITYELRGMNIDVINIFTNNVFAAIHLIGGVKHIILHLFQGRFSHRFAAVYSQEANSRIDNLGITFFILAATSFSFENGIMVDSDDDGNLDFKTAVLEAFRTSPGSELCIAVDSEKFILKTKSHKGIISKDKWSLLLKENANRIKIVTSHLITDTDVERRITFDRECDLFKKAGVLVDL